MKFAHTLLPIVFLLMNASVLAADEFTDDFKIVKIGNTEVFYDYQLTDTGIATLRLNAVVTETNNALRGLKNSDPRRLGKLGQLIYQCKLMLYQDTNGNPLTEATDPILVSKNYSLFTGVDFPLAADERVGVQAQVLRIVEAASLFAPTLGDNEIHKEMGETIGAGAALNLRQFDVNILSETDLIKVSESIDFTIRFPVFQLKKPVNQWFYNFQLNDFNQARRHIDENCTPVKLVELIKQ